VIGHLDVSTFPLGLIVLGAMAFGIAQIADVVRF
jgi:hypothetical protein